MRLHGMLRARSWCLLAVLGGLLFCCGRIGAQPTSGATGQSLTALQRLAAAGEPKAQYALGRRYFNGEGVSQDDAQAAVWFHKAAEQGDADAQNFLGDAYGKGEGVPQDFAQMVAWYRKAAAAGNANAQHSLGSVYYFGDGVTEDQAESARWYRRAAENGNADAQFDLGVMYYDGTGIPQDYAESYFWLSIAAAGLPLGENLEVANQNKIAQRRDAASSHLTKTVLLETQQRARKWFEDHPARP